MYQLISNTSACFSHDPLGAVPLNRIPHSLTRHKAEASSIGLLAPQKKQEKRFTNDPLAPLVYFPELPVLAEHVHDSISSHSGRPEAAIQEVCS